MASTRLPPTAEERAAALLLDGMTASARLGVSRRTLTRLVARGVIVPVKISANSFPRYRAGDLLQLAERGMVGR
ncbi:MAG: hypothetical protein ACOYMV_12805 [Verrucomicrobiia bacterium]